MQNRRQILRNKVIHDGVAETGEHGATMDCAALNDQTAHIEIDRDPANPARARESQSYLAEVIWRQANIVGLAFRTMFSEAPESDLDARLRRSEKKKRELQRRIKQLLSEG
jgi:hypothetical protein